MLFPARRQILRYKSAAAAAIVFSVTFIGNTEDTAATGLATVDYGTVSIGTANPNRVVVVGVFARIDSSSPPVAVSIGGISATQAPSAFVAGGGSMESDIWYASVPTGTTADIQVTWATSPYEHRNGIAVYRVITSTPTPTTGANAQDPSATSIGTTYTVPAGGAGINMASQQFGGALTFTNATLDFDQNASGGSEYAAAHNSIAGSVTVTLNAAGGQQITMSSAAWGP